MPLTLLIPSIERVFASCSTGSAVGFGDDELSYGVDASFDGVFRELESLLLTPRQCSEKYHNRIPHLLFSLHQEEKEGGGYVEEGERREDEEGDMDIMWYAFRNEKPICDDGFRDEGDEEMEERWRKVWLERMERREVQIQVLLHCFLLQYPRPTLQPVQKKRKKKKQRQLPDVSIEDTLESLMDKLAMWQLLSSIDSEQNRRTETKGKGRVHNDDRDWTQRFCEDIVQPMFSKSLPEIYALLHSKVFRHSLFSSSSGDEDEGNVPRASSPKAQQPLQNMKGQGKPSRSGSTTNDIKTESTRARSRSLSVSLEAERRANNNATAASSVKRLLSREVSMSKVFKKSKTSQSASTDNNTVVVKRPGVLQQTDYGTGRTGKAAAGDAAQNKGRILVEGTPVKVTKRVQRLGRTESAMVKMEVDEGDDMETVFAASTPVKGGQRQGLSYSLVDIGEGEEDEWMIGSPSVRAMSRTQSLSSDPGSPDALFLA